MTRLFIYKEQRVPTAKRFFKVISQTVEPLSPLRKFEDVHILQLRFIAFEENF